MPKTAVASLFTAAVVAATILLSGCGGDDDGSLTVRGKDISYDPSEVATEPGEVTLKFENVGALPHNLVFEEDSGLVAGDEEVFLTGGENASYDLQVEAGEYVFYCSVAGHRAAGMEGTLTVG